MPAFTSYPSMAQSPCLSTEAWSGLSLGAGLNSARTTWTYDAAGQLLTENRSGDAPLRSTFAYDPAGNRTLNHRDGVTTSFNYDAANQLNHSLNNAGRTTYLFDPAGNQQVIIAPDLSRTTTVWDAENRPVLYALPTGIRLTQTFNPDTRRLSKETAEGTTHFLWEPMTDAYLQERNAANAITAEYTTEPTQFGPILSQHRDGATSDLLTDALGSIRLVTDDTAAITGSFVYDAWGNPHATTGNLILPFRWVGKLGYYRDAELDSVYIRARTYQPVVARWMNIDPLVFDESATVTGAFWRNLTLYSSLYIYSKNSAVHFSDPSGMAPQDHHWFVRAGGKGYQHASRLCTNHGIYFNIDRYTTTLDGISFGTPHHTLHYVIRYGDAVNELYESSPDCCSLILGVISLIAVSWNSPEMQLHNLGELKVHPWRDSSRDTWGELLGKAAEACGENVSFDCSGDYLVCKSRTQARYEACLRNQGWFCGVRWAHDQAFCDRVYSECVYDLAVRDVCNLVLETPPSVVILVVAGVVIVVSATAFTGGGALIPAGTGVGAGVF